MKAIFSGACLGALLASPAMAASLNDVCSKDSSIAIIRVSTLKAGGTRAGFDKAVADQVAWYRSHGTKDNRIVVADVTNGDDANPAKLPGEIMTIHFDPPAPPACAAKRTTPTRRS